MKTQVLVAAVAGLGVVGSANAGLITNGDFEAGTGLAAAGGASGAADWSSWTETNTQDWHEGDAFGVVNTPDSGDAGVHVVNLGRLNAAIEQDITTVIGQSYDITYLVGMMGGSGSPAKTATLTVTQDGNVVGTDAMSHTAAAAGFFDPQKTLTFVATDTTTTIKFETTADSGGADWGILIDNVDVVPEPGSLALLGLGGLMIARRRRG